MFTGIITALGVVAEITPQADPLYRVSVDDGFLHNVALGASIACSGVCLTVVAIGQGDFSVQVSAETLAITTLATWQVGTVVNLERALRVGDELGGHLVSGHVDAVVTATARASEGDSVRWRFSLPEELRRFIAPKGSITLNGVSLTVNEVLPAEFGVNIIPHTQQHTNFGTMQVGDAVNAEIDMLARYVARLLPAVNNSIA